MTTERKTHFAHFPLAGGIITFAVQRDQTESLHDNLKIGAAFCSPNDQFIKKRGRIISQGRLEAGKLFAQCRVSSDQGISEFLAVYLEKLLRGQLPFEHRHPQIPNWVQERYPFAK